MCVLLILSVHIGSKALVPKCHRLIDQYAPTLLFLLLLNVEYKLSLLLGLNTELAAYAKLPPIIVDSARGKQDTN